MGFPRSEEAWRYHPMFINGHRHAFPGLKNASIIFAGYLVVDFIYNAATAPPSKFNAGELQWEKAGPGQRPTLIN